VIAEAEAVYAAPTRPWRKFKELAPLPGSARRCSLRELTVGGTLATLGQTRIEDDFNYHTDIQ